jgi:hypothetical protein
MSLTLSPSAAVAKTVPFTLSACMIMIACPHRSSALANHSLRTLINKNYPHLHPSEAPRPTLHATREVGRLHVSLAINIRQHLRSSRGLWTSVPGWALTLISSGSVRWSSPAGPSRGSGHVPATI